jgi:hypothetical protein
MPSTVEKQRRFMRGVGLGRLREGRNTLASLIGPKREGVARKLSSHDLLPKRQQRPLTAATLLMRRLRFGSEWL